ncbi:MAG TPA: HTTM domain-containing protein, partial [Bacteroidia bacterium]|nr:HTTM domain-containing protein [Bacteroidia bacterium]
MRNFINSFKHRQTGTTLCRILISLLVIKDLCIYLLHAGMLFSPKDIMPNIFYTDLMASYHLGFLNALFNTHTHTVLFLLFSLLAAILFLLGFVNRISGLILFLCIILLRMRNLYLMDGADNVIWVMLPFLALAPSVPLIPINPFFQPSSRSAAGIIASHIGMLACLGFMIQLSLIYLFTAWSKFQQDIWLNGTAMYYILRLEDFKASGMNIVLTEHSWIVIPLTYLTLLWEGSLPFLIWFPRTRKITILISILMHVGIFLFMHIDNFSFVMISCYPLAFTNSELRDIYTRIRE